ncbi:MAG: 50S ribosomal protein L22 [Planctomycetaceae bacterium]|jgi:large subunit ribosomal protein L22|nr:50S ribosomal protein L22 [Planctomycetaceae bacterium]
MSKESEKNVKPPETFKSVHKYVQMSARKIRPYADLVRGKFADTAVEILSCYPSRGAKLVKQTIYNAIKNAEDRKTSSEKITNLEVLDVRIDGGPMGKRFRPKSRGSSSVFLKRTSHITVIVGFGW